MASKPLVGLIMGSKSDWETMKHAADMLDALQVPYETKVTSAHRTPDRMRDYAKTAKDRGIRVIVAGAGGALALRALRAAPPGGSARWERTNHAGRPVTLLEGPAYAVGAAAGAALLGGSPAPVVATTAAAALGALDDLAGDSSSKGLRGHLGALGRGEVTTGAVKVLGLGVTGLVTAALVDRGRRDVGRRQPHPPRSEAGRSSACRSPVAVSAAQQVRHLRPCSGVVTIAPRA